MDTKPTLIVILGATATGKTDVAAALARKLKTEIISFDSVQVYKELDIGSAKPSIALREEIKHHLIDEIDPNISFTAGDFKRMAESRIEFLKEKHKFIILVGGTGFYLQALQKGMYDAHVIKPEVKEKLKAEKIKRGMESLYAELGELDPEYAKQIHGNDSYRILRALELIRSGALRPSEIQKKFKETVSPYDFKLFGLRRKKDLLSASIRARAQQMMKEGLLKETESLLRKYPHSRALESVGYKEAAGFLNKVPGAPKTEAQLVDEITRSTLALAKRQSTWFKRDAEITWFDSDEVPFNFIVEQILSTLS